MSYYSPITNRNPEPNNRQLLSLLGIFASFLVLILLILSLILNQIVNFIPVSLEQKIGQVIMSNFKEQSKPSSTQSQLNLLLDKVDNVLPQKAKIKRNYQVLYIPEKTINALAIPGDAIIIYEGLLKEIESENELVMILGHELGHFAHRDHLRSLGNILMMKILVNYFFGNWENVQSGIDFVNIIANSKYSQKQESEADEFGLNLLNTYYGHVAGATDFFERLAKDQKTLEIALLSSHPLPKKRIKKLQQLIKKNNYLLGEKKNLNFSFD